MESDRYINAFHIAAYMSSNNSLLKSTELIYPVCYVLRFINLLCLGQFSHVVLITDLLNIFLNYWQTT